MRGAPPERTAGGAFVDEGAAEPRAGRWYGEGPAPVRDRKTGPDGRGTAAISSDA
ncbi:hypothetical protein GCM10017687_31010 [Streptomyces echinatus]